ncbi:hypothetical protein V8D89_012349 [Ganoderma adspersum]
MPTTTTTASDTTTARLKVPASEPEPAHCPAPAPGDQTSSTSDSHFTPELQPTPEQQAQLRKQPMREFVWGENLIRKTLPRPTLPRWLDPLWVDIHDPTQLPLCWYGVPFVPQLLYACAERIGLASYYTVEVLSSNPGDLDPFQTWGNVQEWFNKRSGLKLDLNLVWDEEGNSDTILTFWSNHEMNNITPKMWDLTCELLDYLEYGEEYELLWCLDHNLRY